MMSPAFEPPPSMAEIGSTATFMGHYVSKGGALSDFEFLRNHSDAMMAVIQFVSAIYKEYGGEDEKTTKIQPFHQSVTMRAPSATDIGSTANFKVQYVALGGRVKHFDFLSRDEPMMGDLIDLVRGLIKLEKKRVHA